LSSSDVLDHKKAHYKPQAARLLQCCYWSGKSHYLAFM